MTVIPNAMDDCNGDGNVAPIVPIEPIQPINRRIPVPTTSAINIVIVPFSIVHADSENVKCLNFFVIFRIMSIKCL